MFPTDSAGATLSFRNYQYIRTDSLNKINNYYTNGYVGNSSPHQETVNAAPTFGTWKKGDVVYNSNAVASGYIGWVCTTAGTPGTWKTFGAITA